MLSEEEKQEIEAEFKHYPHKQAVCIEAMKIVQRHRGWVSDESITDIAEFLDMTPDELDGVATFYNILFRRPVGKHIIHICDSVSCWIMGYERLRDFFASHLDLELGETTADDRFTLVPIQCLGICEYAPALMIDNELYTDLDPGKLEMILKKFDEEPA